MAKFKETIGKAYRYGKRQFNERLSEELGVFGRASGNRGVGLKGRLSEGFKMAGANLLGLPYNPRRGGSGEAPDQVFRAMKFGTTSTSGLVGATFQEIKPIRKMKSYSDPFLKQTRVTLIGADFDRSIRKLGNTELRKPQNKVLKAVTEGLGAEFRTIDKELKRTKQSIVGLNRHIVSENNRMFNDFRKSLNMSLKRRFEALDRQQRLKDARLNAALENLQMGALGAGAGGFGRGVGETSASSLLGAGIAGAAGVGVGAAAAATLRKAKDLVKKAVSKTASAAKKVGTKVAPQLLKAAPHLLKVVPGIGATIFAYEIVMALKSLADIGLGSGEIDTRTPATREGIVSRIHAQNKDLAIELMKIWVEVRKSTNSDAEADRIFIQELAPLIADKFPDFDFSRYGITKQSSNVKTGIVSKPSRPKVPTPKIPTSGPGGVVGPKGPRSSTQISRTGSRRAQPSFETLYNIQRTNEQKAEFLKYGKLPTGFEFLPGHMGRLGSAGAVSARGAMPLGGGYSGGYSGGMSGGYSGGGTMPAAPAPRTGGTSGGATPAPAPRTGGTAPTSTDGVLRQGQFGFTRGAARSKARDADPRLVKIMEEAAKTFPLRARLFSAGRSSGRGSGAHGRGLAVDVQLYDENGVPISSYQTPQTANIYALWAEHTRRTQQKLFPELDKEFAWIGGLRGMRRGGGGGKYGAADFMDFRIGYHNRVSASNMGGYKWGKGWQKGYEYYTEGDFLGIGPRVNYEEHLSRLKGLKLTPEQIKKQYELAKKGKFRSGLLGHENIGPRKPGSTDAVGQSQQLRGSYIGEAINQRQQGRGSYSGGAIGDQSNRGFGNVYTGTASTYDPRFSGYRTGGMALATGRNVKGRWIPNRYSGTEYEAAIKLGIARKEGVGIGTKVGFALVEYKGKRLIVRVNDNGPLTPGRVIDLNSKSMQYFNENAKPNQGLLKGAKVTMLQGSGYQPGPVDSNWKPDIPPQQSPVAVRGVTSSISGDPRLQAYEQLKAMGESRSKQPQPQIPQQKPPTIRTRGLQQSKSAQQSNQEYKFDVTSLTRNKLTLGRKPGNRNISLDFNSVRDSRVSGALIVIPDNATPQEVMAARQYLEGVQRIMEKYGHKGYKLQSGGKYGPGIRTTSENGRGLKGVFHTEGWFTGDKKAVEIMSNPDAQNEYAEMLARSLGNIKGARFIAPHVAGGNEGAAMRIGNKSVSETKYAREYIIPRLKNLKEKTELSTPREQKNIIPPIPMQKPSTIRTRGLQQMGPRGPTGPGGPGVPVEIESRSVSTPTENKFPFADSRLRYRFYGAGKFSPDIDLTSGLRTLPPIPTKKPMQTGAVPLQAVPATPATPVGATPLQAVPATPAMPVGATPAQAVPGTIETSRERRPPPKSTNIEGGTFAQNPRYRGPISSASRVPVPTVPALPGDPNDPLINAEIARQKEQEVNNLRDSLDTDKPLIDAEKARAGEGGAETPTPPGEGGAAAPGADGGPLFRNNPESSGAAPGTDGRGSYGRCFV